MTHRTARLSLPVNSVSSVDLDLFLTLTNAKKSWGLISDTLRVDIDIKTFQFEEEVDEEDEGNTTWRKEKNSSAHRKYRE